MQRARCEPKPPQPNFAFPSSRWVPAGRALSGCPSPPPHQTKCENGMVHTHTGERSNRNKLRGKPHSENCADSPLALLQPQQVLIRNPDGQLMCPPGESASPLTPICRGIAAGLLLTRAPPPENRRGNSALTERENADPGPPGKPKPALSAPTVHWRGMRKAREAEASKASRGHHTRKVGLRPLM